MNMVNMDMVDIDMVDISMSKTFLAQFGLVLHPAPPFLTSQWLETYFNFFVILTIWTFGICSADIRRLLRKTITLSSPCKVWFLPQKTCLALPQKIQFPSSSLFPLFHQFLSDLIQWHILCRCIHNIYFGFYIKSVLSFLFPAPKSEPPALSN